MAASMARGSSFLKSIWSTRTSASFLRSSRSRITPSSPFPSRGLQRKSVVLSSLLPLHSAIASSCLVCRLPSEVASSFEVRDSKRPGLTFEMQVGLPTISAPSEQRWTGTKTSPTEA